MKNEHTDPANPGNEAVEREPTPADQLEPKPGELGIPDVASARRESQSKKGLFAVGLLAASLIAAGAVAVQRVVMGLHQPKSDATLVRDRPMAASTDPRKLDMTSTPPAQTSAASASAPRIPAIEPTGEELGESIGVRRTGETGPASGGQRVARPEDAPTMLVSARPGTSPAQAIHRGFVSDATGNAGSDADPAEPGSPLEATSRNLQGYQRQLQGLLDQLTRTTTSVAGEPPEQWPARLPSGSGVLSGAGSPGSPGRPAADGGLFGGQLQGSSTAGVQATMLGDRSLILPKGTAFTCALKTKVISAASGLVGCQVQRNVFSDDGRVLLVERGSHLDGEYRVTSVRPGTVRIPVLWTRLRTPFGVTVELDSPGTGQLGESGIDGYVDNRWGERIGAAMLLSLIDDSVKLVIQNQANERQGDTIVMPSTTANTSKLAEKVLDSTINIPPLIYQNQGGIVGIYVARDIDFSSVYELQPTALNASQQDR